MPALGVRHRRFGHTGTLGVGRRSGIPASGPDQLLRSGQVCADASGFAPDRAKLVMLSAEAPRIVVHMDVGS